MSDVKTSDQKRPTVAECLVYWFGSAVGIPGGWEIPEVSGEYPHILTEMPCIVRDIMSPINNTEDRRALLALCLLS